MYIRTSYFHAQKLDNSGNGTFNDRNRSVGEHTNPEYEVRTDFNHRIGPLSHTLQWFWTSGTVTDDTIPKELFPEQNPNFVAEDWHFFNYNAVYDVNDNLRFRLVVNNLTDTEKPRGALFGNPNPFDNGVGREFIFGVNARF
jgi:outer membrane receptor for ferrienterochelin and colicin